MRDRVVIVTGGSSGIGLASAFWFAQRGANVFVADVDRLAESARTFESLGVRLSLCDVRDESAVEPFVRSVVQLAGRVDVLVNNAGVEAVGPITAIRVEDWDRCLDTNLKGAFLFCKHVIPAMAERGGAIVNVASNAGILPRAHDPVYCISKAGLVMLTKALALAHAPQRIRVNAVCPGPVRDTRMMERDLEQAPDKSAKIRQLIDASPLSAAWGRMATPEEIADAIGYLADDSAAMVTGTVLAIDGGKSLGVPPKAS